MAGNTFGRQFTVTTFGESHGGCVGCVVDGCPSGLRLSESDIQPDLDRRKPGQSAITTQRKEEDTIHILSGVFEGMTTGAPIALVAYNKDARSNDYTHLRDVFRPSHADYTYTAKYGLRDWKGGGRSSARETLARVAAGAIAKKYLKEVCGLECIAYVEQVGEVLMPQREKDIRPEAVEANIVRCPDEATATRMKALIEEVRDAGDTVGGVIRCIMRNVPVGWGEPVFDRFSADLAKAMMSIQAAKGFDIGSGFTAARMRGSEHNDPFYRDGKGAIRTRTNNSGGVQGGITNGESVEFRVAFKPVSTIRKEQETVRRDGTAAKIAALGRHDPCVLPRAVPIVEAMAALVAMDHYLRSAGIRKYEA